MKNSKSKRFQDPDLTIPSQSWGIFLISVLGLFIETLFIRWIGTEIRIFAYLQNTILVVCFIGLGIGMFTASRPIAFKHSLIPLTILLILMAMPVTRSALGNISQLLSTMGDLVIWYSGEAEKTSQQILSVFAGLALTFIVLTLLVDIFVPIGRTLGRLMNVNSNPIWAYSVNILGSILGTWMFVLFSFLYLPPFVWFLATAVLLSVFVAWSNRDKKLNFALLGLTVMLSWFAGRVPNANNVIWSPYQKLVVSENPADGLGDFRIDVKNTGYQALIDLSEDRVAADPQKFPPELNGLSQYDLPLLLHPNPRSVLLVGAGSGNDAAGALRHNVESVTAVEIDPAIISIGRELHPEQPYSSPKVKVVNDDARSFFATTPEKYDVIVFGLLDSHTTTALTNARLDHYVYTRESILRARSRLAEGGIMVLTFEAQKYFIADRMGLVLEQIFNQESIRFRIPASSYGWGGVMFVTGDMKNVQAQLDKNPALAAYIADLQQKNPIPLTRSTIVTTDDWPYIYLESPKIPVLYYLLIGLMIIVFARGYRKWEAIINVSFRGHAFWHFFFLGAAFLLLEVQNISKASVVLGNTWQVNTVIISSILAMALLANLIAYKFPNLPLRPIYFILIVTCLALYFLDLARFGFLPYLVKAITVGALTSLPMLFSGIIFTRSFAIATDKSNALGANLIGALMGALLQSITFVTGIRSLLVVVAGFYLLSYLTTPSPSELSEVEVAEPAQ
jgi:spermidine synthase